MSLQPEENKTVSAIANEKSASAEFADKNPFRESLEVQKEYQEIRSGDRIVNVGSGNELDKALQHDLKTVLAKNGIEVDGPLTDQHVRQAQSIMGVRVDGDIGPETMRALDTSLGRTFAVASAGSTNAIEYWLSETEHQLAIFKSRGMLGLDSLSMNDIQATMKSFLDKDTGQYEVGSIAALFESGGRGSGTISTGAGDFGGKSYGTYQLASRVGTLQTFLQASGYNKEFSGMTPGSAEFDSKWKELASNDSNFGKSQHAFIRATHFEPQINKLKENGIDLSGRGVGVQEMVFSTANQYGPNTGVIVRALKGNDVAAMGDKQIISTVQADKRAHIHSDFKSSDSNIRLSVLNRTKAEERALLMATDAKATA